MYSLSTHFRNDYWQFLFEIFDAQKSHGALKRCFLRPRHKGQDKFRTGPWLGPDRPCVHTGPLGTVTVKATYMVRSGSTCKKGPGLVWTGRTGPTLDWIERGGMSSVWTVISNMMFLLFIFNNFSRLAEWKSNLHNAFTFWVFSETRITLDFSSEGENSSNS